MLQKISWFFFWSKILILHKKIVLCRLIIIFLNIRHYLKVNFKVFQDFLLNYYPIKEFTTQNTSCVAYFQNYILKEIYIHREKERDVCVLFLFVYEFISEWGRWKTKRWKILMKVVEDLWFAFRSRRTKFNYIHTWNYIKICNDAKKMCEKEFSKWRVTRFM